MILHSILTKLEDGILTVTINAPEKLNALNKQTFVEINEVFSEVYSNGSIKGVIITGAGNKAFVAGADITEFANYTQEEGKALSAHGHSILNLIENCPKPVIAAVNGFALGGGCELAMACHLRIASENAKFGQPEVKLGVIPGYGGTQRLIQLIGKGKAVELLMTGDFIGAEEARQLGLVNHVVPQDQLLAKCGEVMKKITAQSPSAVAGIVTCVAAYFTDGVNGLEAEINAFGNCFGTEDFKEGTAAFLEKRVARFTSPPAPLL